MNSRIKSIANHFKFEGELVNVEANSQGNINTTFVLTYDNNGVIKRYLIQKINASVFKEPYLVMKNIELVTNHIRKKLDMEKDTCHKTLSIVPTITDESLYAFKNESGEKEYFRAFEFIERCTSFDSLKQSGEPKKTAYEVGKCLGHFQRLLADAPISQLHETIKDFHNTPLRFEALLQSIKDQGTNRAYECTDVIVDLISQVKECSLISDALGKSIPIRVTHNDTKLNNVLMSQVTGKGIALIDLDTVMPGSALFDVGDGIRSACSDTYEDDDDYSRATLNLDSTKAYLRGYLEEMADYLTNDEINFLGLSIKVLTYELVVRFLTDYINGDTYFKIKYRNHNKDRFLNQYHLLKDIDTKLPEINDFIAKTVKEIKGKKRTLSQA